MHTILEYRAGRKLKNNSNINNDNKDLSPTTINGHATTKPQICDDIHRDDDDHQSGRALSETYHDFASLPVIFNVSCKEFAYGKSDSLHNNNGGHASVRDTATTTGQHAAPSTTTTCYNGHLTNNNNFRNNTPHKDPVHVFKEIELVRTLHKVSLSKSAAPAAAHLNSSASLPSMFKSNCHHYHQQQQQLWNTGADPLKMSQKKLFPGAIGRSTAIIKNSNNCGGAGFHQFNSLQNAYLNITNGTNNIDKSVAGLQQNCPSSISHHFNPNPKQIIIKEKNSAGNNNGTALLTENHLNIKSDAPLLPSNKIDSTHHLNNNNVNGKLHNSSADAISSSPPASLGPEINQHPAAVQLVSSSSKVMLPGFLEDFGGAADECGNENEFFLRENDVGVGVRDKVAEEATSFAGFRNYMLPERVICGETGTVRGMRNRVRAGIATFRQQAAGGKNFHQLEANKVVVYTTATGIVRETFQQCLKVKTILSTLLVSFEERDIFRCRAYQRELVDRLGDENVRVPQVFVEAHYLGDANAIERLNECGRLRKILRPYKRTGAIQPCHKCGGYLLLLCSACNGSKKSLTRNQFSDSMLPLRCVKCDECGLVPCDLCCAVATSAASPGVQSAQKMPTNGNKV